MPQKNKKPTDLNPFAQAFVPPQMEAFLKSAHEEFMDPSNFWPQTFPQSNPKNDAAQNSEAFTEATETLWKDAFKLLENTGQRLQNTAAPPDPVIQTDAQDRRFKDPAWVENPLFDYIKQSYLLFTRWTINAIDHINGLTEKDREQIKFMTERLMDSLSPTNFPWTNPRVIAKTISENGANLIKGMENFLQDFQNSAGNFQIKNVDTSPFKLGENLASTPGKVIYQNDLMELIQYAPSTPSVHQTPLLIVPPWINRFYLFDLSDHNSFIKWMVDKGHTVFVISWINPLKEHAHKTFEDYMREGPLEALQVLQKITSTKQVNVVGHCIGAILLTCLLGYLGPKASKYVKSATLITPLTDFSKAGTLRLFADSSVMSLIEKSVKENGYLDGSILKNMFDLMKANDLIWSSYVNNYLLGQDAPAFDLLYWNADSTRFPGKMFFDYIQNFFQENLLIKPNGLKFFNKGIDIRKIQVPTFILSTLQDHIAPWHSGYATTQYFKGPNRFILSESGHIAGVINPPSKNKYGYWKNPETPSTPEEWFQNAEKVTESWWLEWDRWVSDFKGSSVPARAPGNDDYPSLGDAPGKYVES